jgi:hypothetical protein
VLLPARAVVDRDRIWKKGIWEYFCCLVRRHLTAALLWTAGHCHIRMDREQDPQCRGCMWQRPMAAPALAAMSSSSSSVFRRLVELRNSRTNRRKNQNAETPRGIHHHHEFGQPTRWQFPNDPSAYLIEAAYLPRWRWRCHDVDEDFFILSANVVFRLSLQFMNDQRQILSWCEIGIDILSTTVYFEYAVVLMSTEVVDEGFANTAAE